MKRGIHIQVRNLVEEKRVQFDKYLQNEGRIKKELYKKKYQEVKRKI